MGIDYPGRRNRDEEGTFDSCSLAEAWWHRETVQFRVDLSLVRLRHGLAPADKVAGNPTTGGKNMSDAKVVSIGLARSIIKGCLAAANELMAEFVSGKRAADWAVINDGLCRAEQFLRKTGGIEGGQK